MTKQERADMYVELLQAEGFPATIDADGDVEYKCEGHTYWIGLDDDEHYVRLLKHFFWPIESDEERARALDAISEANRTIKAVKLYLMSTGDSVGASISWFVSSPEIDWDVFLRAHRTLQAGIFHFVRRMNDEAS